MATMTESVAPPPGDTTTDTTTGTTTGRTTGRTTDASAEVRIEADGRWLTVCSVGDLTAGRGVAAVLPDGEQIAIFLDRSGRTYAIGNRDPFTGARVLSRGLLGSVDGRPFVASPLLKQRFDLATGRCLDDAERSVPVHPADIVHPTGTAIGPN